MVPDCSALDLLRLSRESEMWEKYKKCGGMVGQKTRRRKRAKNWPCTMSIRYERLQQISARSLQESIKVLTLDQLISCYPTMATLPKGKEVMEQALKQIAEFWKVTALKEFDTIYEERDIKAKFEQLDELIADAKTRKQAFESNQHSDPAHGPVVLASLTPEIIVESHLKTQGNQRLSELEKRLNGLKFDNDKLLDELNTINCQIQTVAESILQSFDQIDLSVEAAQILPSRSELTDFLSEVANRMA